MRNILVLGLAALAGILLGAGWAQARESIVLSPEVRAQADPFILSGVRPRIATLRPDDLFELRAKPKFDADFVRLSVIPQQLTTPQRAILSAWLRSGHNRILLTGIDMSLYAPLFGLRGEYHGSRFDRLQFGSHEVNTDCLEVSGNVNLVTLPEGSVVMATRGLAPACGMFRHGETFVLFHPDLRGNDAGRWRLNFQHWAMGRPVPGATVTNIADGATVAVETQDRVTLRDGETFAGELAIASLEVAVGDARETVARADVQRVVLDFEPGGVDLVVGRDGKRTLGRVALEKLELRLAAGGTVNLPRGNVKVIDFALPPSAP